MSKSRNGRCGCRNRIVSSTVQKLQQGCTDVCVTPQCGSPEVLSLMAPLIYDEIGINMRVMRSEVFPIYAAKKLPMHMYCADNEIDVRYAIEHGAALITANEPVPLLTVLGRM